MSCLFNSMAALLADRPRLLRESRFEEPRDLPRPPSGRDLRAAVCALLRRRELRVHDVGLDEWGAMEAGTQSDAYVRIMRDEGTWGGGVEIAALAAALRVPIEVEGAARATFGEAYARRPLRLHYTGSHYTPRP
jgi:hypothetical protein